MPAQKKNADCCQAVGVLVFNAIGSSRTAMSLWKRGWAGNRITGSIENSLALPDRESFCTFEKVYKSQSIGWGAASTSIKVTQQIGAATWSAYTIIQRSQIRKIRFAVRIGIARQDAETVTIRG